MTARLSAADLAHMRSKFSDIDQDELQIDEHDHDARCCIEHGTHSMPHIGCMLR